MDIISKKALSTFWQQHPQAKQPLRGWFVRVKHSKWRNFAELRQVYPSADLVGRLTVFNIGGGNYRLIVRVEYGLQQIYIRHILTHAEYDKEKWKNDDWYA